MKKQAGLLGDFFSSLFCAIWYGIVAAFCAGGLFYIFWGLFDYNLGRPLESIPRFDAILLVATPFVEFLIVGIMAFVLDWRKRRKRTPSPANSYN